VPTFCLVKTSEGEIRGRSQADDAAYRKHLRMVDGLEAGEFFTVSVKRPRNGKFHRKLFAMLTYAFEHWEPARSRKRLKFKGVPIEKNFESFREQATILAGFYEQSFDLKGRMHLRAKSIAYDSMDADDFEKLYSAVLDVLLKHVFINHKREDVEEVIAQLERFG
jgi:hypothetical protein